MHFPVSVGAGARSWSRSTAWPAPTPCSAACSWAAPGHPRRRLRPPYESAPQGTWVNTYGHEGYDDAAWNGSAGDLASMPQASISLEQGVRATWAAPTTDVRALQAPDGSERRATTLADNNEVRVRLTFPAAYTGTLHLYALDWDSTAAARERDRHRRHHDQDRRDHDQLQRRGLDALPGQRRRRGLGRGQGRPRGRRQRRAQRPVPGRRRGPPPPPPPAVRLGHPRAPGSTPTASTATTIAGWNGVDAISRSCLQATHRARAGGPGRPGRRRPPTSGRSRRPTDRSAGPPPLADNNQIRVRLTFASAYTGHPAPVRGRLGQHDAARDGDRHRRHHDQDRRDHDRLQRRGLDALPGQRRRRRLGLVTVDRVAGANAVLSGLFLGGAGDPPPPPPPAVRVAPQGTWVDTYGDEGYDDRRLERVGERPRGPCLQATHRRSSRGSGRPGPRSTTDVRALQAPDGSERRATASRRQQPDPGAADVRQRLHRDPAPVRGRLGQHRPPPER